MPTVEFEGNLIEAEDGETVLSALLRHGVDVGHGCQAGACQSCLLRAPAAAPPTAQKGLDDTVAEAGGFLACMAKAKDVPSATRFDPDYFPTYAADLVEKRALSATVLLVRLAVPELPRCPGRFVQLTGPTGVRRPYSVATSALDANGLVDFHVRLIPGGEMSEALLQAMPGDKFSIQGPYGKCCYRPGEPCAQILLIGSGTGLAPLYAVATDALSQGHTGRIEVFFGASSPEGLYFLDELRCLAASYPNLAVTVCVDAGPLEGQSLGSPLQHALQAIPDMADTTVYSCGHPALVKAAQRQCFLAGASMKRIFVDAFEPAGRA
ncbi:MAG: 2Fe-2S iron-sulfur cluster binding domain-containing protein [Armatimonadetes bacterium]|nr:2Fe-2S iron-sulfur cluster binding domain-containing protein [Armatimonadota bacterium]